MVHIHTTAWGRRMVARVSVTRNRSPGWIRHALLARSKLVCHKEVAAEWASEYERLRPRLSHEAEDVLAARLPLLPIRSGSGLRRPRQPQLLGEHPNEAS